MLPTGRSKVHSPPPPDEGYALTYLEVDRERMSRKRTAAPPHPVFRGNQEDEVIPKLDFEDENFIGMTMADIMEQAAQKLCTTYQYLLKRHKAKSGGSVATPATRAKIQSEEDVPAVAEEIRAFLRVTIENAIRDKGEELKAPLLEKIRTLESDLKGVRKELMDVKNGKVELEQKLTVYKRRLLDAKMKLSAASAPPSSSSSGGKPGKGRGKPGGKGKV